MIYLIFVHKIWLKWRGKIQEGKNEGLLLLNLFTRLNGVKKCKLKRNKDDLA